MSELVRFEGPDDSELVVEVADDGPGLELIGRRDDGVIQARRSLRQALDATWPTLRAVVGGVRALAPQEVEIDFGMKFSGETGVVIAKAATEGHFAVRLRWTAAGADAAAGAPAAPAAHSGGAEGAGTEGGGAGEGTTDGGRPGTGRPGGER